MIQVYIASPYSKGDKLENVRRQIRAAEAIMTMGACPVVPLYSHYHNELFPHDYEDWMKIDYEKIRRCDWVVRLPGESEGADREVKYAKKLLKPVFDGLRDLTKQLGRIK